MFKVQKKLNNFLFNIDKIFNETTYDFTSIQLFDFMLKKFFSKNVATNFRVAQRIIRFEVTNVIFFNQMYSKLQYDRKHQSFYMKIDD